MGDVDNLSVWRLEAVTPKEYTKPLPGGARLTTIDAYYSLMCATKHWGPMGQRWGLRDCTVTLHEGQWLIQGTFFHPGLPRPEGRETSFFIANNYPFMARGGGKPDENAVKSLVTNTIGKALSYLGFHNDIYFGKFADPLPQAVGVAPPTPGDRLRDKAIAEVQAIMLPAASEPEDNKHLIKAFKEAFHGVKFGELGKVSTSALAQGLKTLKEAVQ